MEFGDQNYECINNNYPTQLLPTTTTTPGFVHSLHHDMFLYVLWSNINIKLEHQLHLRSQHTPWISRLDLLAIALSPGHSHLSTHCFIMKYILLKSCEYNSLTWGMRLYLQYCI